MYYTRMVMRMGGNGSIRQTNKVKVLAEYPNYYLLEVEAKGGKYRECASKFAIEKGSEKLHE